MYCQRASARARRRALSIVLWSCSGNAWKCAKTTVQPRFMRRQAATGESMPPESSAITRPALPTGKPPGPGTFSNE